MQNVYAKLYYIYIILFTAFMKQLAMLWAHCTAVALACM